MGRSWVPVGAVVLVLAALPATAAAQGSGRRCNQVLPADARQLVNALGQEVVYFRDPVRMVCTGGLVIEADSAMFNRGEGAMQLVGNVVYRDSTRQLTAEWANYLGAPDVLFARGAVVLRDMADGSRVTGEELEFRRQTAERPQSLMVVRGQRPHAVVPARAREGTAPGAGPPTGAPADTAPPVEVWANRLVFQGETTFLAEGDAEIRRGDLEGAADTARFDQLAEQMTLLGGGHVENELYRLEGERIDAYLPDDTLREVRAVGATRLISDDLRVRSERLRIALAEGQLERLEAWNPEGIEAYRPAPPAPAVVTGDPAPAPAEAERPRAGTRTRTALAGAAGAQPDTLAPLPRAIAVAENFTLRADSIDARADAGQIREVRAVSRAFGERSVDSLAVGRPPLLARDWIQGDTIVGYFGGKTTPADTATVPRMLAGVDAPPGREDAWPGAEEGDTTEVVLERIVVVGGGSPALSLYRMAPESPGDKPAINFMQAQRIVLHLTAGDLDRVEAAGPIEGVYLDPAAARSGAGEEPPVEETGG